MVPGREPHTPVGEPGGPAEPGWRSGPRLGPGEARMAEPVGLARRRALLLLRR